MEKRKLGKSGIEVTAIGLGTNAVGGHNLYPSLDEEQGKSLVRTAIDKGITLIDTAYRYGNGRSEELIGEVLKEYDRSKVILATKAAHTDPEKDIFDNSPEFLKRSVHEALERLKTNYLDIFFIHFPDETTNKGIAVEALAKLKEEGLIRSIGVSNFSLNQVIEANSDGLVDVVEDEYNFLNHQNEATLLKYCKDNGLAFIPFFPLASGVLTGKYTSVEQLPEGDFRRSLMYFQPEKLELVNQARRDLEKLAEKYDVTIANVVLNWYLSRSTITSIIPGAKTTAQVIDNLKTVSFKLTDYEKKMIEGYFY